MLTQELEALNDMNSAEEEAIESEPLIAVMSDDGFFWDGVRESFN
jgi:hypothetical protein